MIIPYLDITIHKAFPFLEKVTISPYNKNAQAKSTLERYLSDSGYSSTVVSVSNLPVRF